MTRDEDVVREYRDGRMLPSRVSVHVYPEGAGILVERPGHPDLLLAVQPEGAEDLGRTLILAGRSRTTA